MNEPALESFLEPAPGVQCEPREVFDLARQVARGSANDVEAAGRLFVYVRDTVRYSVRVPFEPMEEYQALNTLARGKGYCVQKAALLCALARALGIPARLGFADIRNFQFPEELTGLIGDNVLTYHCFTEWFLGGQWYKATPAFDAALSAQRGWRVVEFAPGQDLLLPATTLEGRPHIQYLAQRGWRHGVPLEEMMANWIEELGRARMDAWRAWTEGEAEA